MPHFSNWSLLRFRVLQGLDSGRCISRDAIALQLVQRAVDVAIPNDLLAEITRHRAIRREHQLQVEHLAVSCARRCLREHPARLVPSRSTKPTKRVEEVIVAALS